MANPDEKDEAALEEERLARSLQHSKLHGRNAYAAAHAAPPKKNSAPSFNTLPAHGNGHGTGPGSPSGEAGPHGGVTVGARGPKIVKDQHGGPLPEWKRVQMEREEAERKRIEEEERRKKMYSDQIVHSASSGFSNVDTTSAMSGGSFVDPLAKKSPESPVKAAEDPVTPGKAMFDGKDEDEELRREEDYLNRRTGNVVAPKKKSTQHISQNSLTGNSEKDAHLALNSRQQKVLVIYVDSVTAEPIEQLPFFANAGRLPMLAVEGALKIKNVVWKDTKQALTAGPDGFSTVSVGNRNFIEVIADKQ